MKQLGVVNFASFTEKSSKMQHKAVSQNQRKYMAQKHATDYIRETFRSLETQYISEILFFFNIYLS